VFTFKDCIKEILFCLVLDKITSYQDGQNDHINTETTEDCKACQSMLISSKMVAYTRNNWSCTTIEKTVENNDENRSEPIVSGTELRVSHILRAYLISLNLLAILSFFNIIN
jgi:hypothetical protein